MVLLHYTLWLVKKNSRHFFNQSDVKLKPFVSWSHAFSRAWRQLHVFASSSDWFHVLFSSVVIDKSVLLWFWFYYTQLKTALMSKLKSLKDSFVHSVNIDNYTLNVLIELKFEFLW